MKIKIATIEEINNSKKSWNNLVKCMKLPSVFLTWEWITTWIKHFGEDYKLLILFMYDKGELTAILPLAQRPMKLEDGFLKVNAITFCGSLELYPDHLDIICAKQDNAEIYMRHFFNFLTYDYNKWDILQFSFAAGEGNLATWCQSTNSVYKVKEVNSTIAPYLSMESNFDTFLKKNMKRKKRYNLNREKKILIEENNAKLIRIENLEELEKGLEDLFRLHRIRANEKGITSTFIGRKIYNFHKELSKIFLELGWLRFYLLEKEHKAISIVYGFVFERRYNFYQTGLDPEWKEYSPGKVMVFTILEDLFNENIIEFDFLGGDDPYKIYWTKQYREMFTFNIFNKNVSAFIENYANKMRNVAKSLLIRTSTYDRLKSLIKKANS